MSRLIGVSLAALGCVFVLTAGTASAQGYPYGGVNPPAYGPGYRPQLSPYLNLIRGGDPAANYFLGTLPEFDRRANARLFGSAILDLEHRTANPSGLEEDVFKPLAETGHPTAFQNYGTYYGPNPTRFGNTNPQNAYKPGRPRP